MLQCPLKKHNRGNYSNNLLQMWYRETVPVSVPRLSRNENCFVFQGHTWLAAVVTSPKFHEAFILEMHLNRLRACLKFEKTIWKNFWPTIPVRGQISWNWKIARKESPMSLPSNKNSKPTQAALASSPEGLYNFFLHSSRCYATRTPHSTTNRAG